MPMRTKSKNRMQILGAMSNICFPTSLLSRALPQDGVIPVEWIGLSRPAHLLSLPFSGFSSLFREGWLPGMTEMTSRLFPLLFFWELSESSLLLAESLRAERDEEEGLFDSLGVFLSSPEKLRKTNQVCYLGDEDPRIIAIMGGG